MIFPSIRARVLSLAIIPTTAASLIFFSYFVTKQNNDIEETLTAKGNDVAAHLASASEYSIFSGNISLLSPLVDAAYQDNNIVSITITDDRGTPLIQRPERLSESNALSQRAGAQSITNTSINNRVFSKPVIQSLLSISDFDEPEEQELPAIIGWVVVEITGDITEQRKREATIETLFITLAILISSIYLATRISRHITTPITTLTEAVNEIERGNLDVSVNTHTTGELLSLEQGIRGMLRAIRTSRADAQQKIKKATGELRESLELLERKNQDLYTARQEALSASRAKSSFLANISHEIRTPMNGILGFVRLLNTTSLSNEQNEYLRTIEQSAHNLLRIINDVLDLSKIEAGKLSIQNTQFNLRECIEDVELLMSPAANDKGLEIAALFYDDTPEIINAPQDRIRQVLINLLGNAIKFSTKGTIVVRAMIEARNTNAATIKLSVSDQGSGISEKNQQALFNSFTQLDDNASLKHSGTGLGLVISKSLAKAMNGDIGVESRLNEGSTFWFTFICSLSPNSVELTDKSKAFSGKVAGIYDTNELSRLCTAHTLRKIGFSVKEYSIIDELSDIIKNNTELDILLLNLNNNDINNFPLSLTDPKNNISHKLLTTINSSAPEAMRKHGFNSYLTRPFRRSDLIFSIKNIIPGQNSPLTGDSGKQKLLDENKKRHRRLDGINILVAEDNAINAKFIDTILQRSGAVVLVVNNGQEVVDAFEEGDFDVILMDINMPVMDGIQATKLIRNSEAKNKRIPILGLTAVSFSDEKPFCREAGFDDVLEKPISVDELLHEIAYWVHTPTTHLKALSFSDKSTVDQSPDTQSTATYHQESTDTLAQLNTGQLGIDKGLSASMFEMLLAELPATRESLTEYFSTQNWIDLRSEVHRFLGGLSYCDVPKLQTLTQAFQQSLKLQDDKLTPRFEAMILEISALISASESS